MKRLPATLLTFISDVASCCLLDSSLYITTGWFRRLIQNEDELAANLGHHIAHIVARHKVERLCIIPAEWSLLLAIAGFVPLRSPTRSFLRCLIFGLAFAQAASFGWSLLLRKVFEQEADYISLLLMADAGFNSTGAISFWTKRNEPCSHCSKKWDLWHRWIHHQVSSCFSNRPSRVTRCWLSLVVACNPSLSQRLQASS